MNKVVTIHDAKTNLSKYIKKAKTGNPVYIGSYGEQEVVLMSAKPEKTRVKFGTAAGKFRYSDSVLEGVDEDVQFLFYGKG
ncbi:MAG TPA: type II toxin-antitoxin system prevent-host-death family antitoxin [Candidatus Saccharimonadales bacterium]|jgi:prevent-host-death family protein